MWPIDSDGDDALPPRIFQILPVISFVKMVATLSSDTPAVSPALLGFPMNHRTGAPLDPLRSLVLSFISSFLLCPFASL